MERVFEMLDGETYLGDGLYASFDGYQIQLRAPRFEGDHFVYLEPDVYAALRRYADQRLAPEGEDCGHPTSTPR